ncbi:hypothetical protein IWX49DRAFT_553110 [Phyllosticta citricarpa]|uniref:Uncharacterized protein n=2 Tax=Phyllosticta TaxID=121621 RepID=A0ABR1LT28_9PEZI
MSHRRKKKINWSTDTEYRVRFEKDIPQLPLRKTFVAHPKWASDMGHSGPEDSKRSRFIAPEIWLEIIKNAMPHTIEVTKKMRTGIWNHGFHLELLGSSLSFIMKLAQLSKTWYSEVKEALYALPLWSFDANWYAHYHFLGPLSSPGPTDDSSFSEYDATISRIRRVRFQSYQLNQSTWIWPNLRQLDLLSPLNRLMRVSFTLWTLHPIMSNFMTTLLTVGPRIMTEAVNLTAKLGNSMSKVLSLIGYSFFADVYIAFWNVPKALRDICKASREADFCNTMSQHIATVLSDTSLVATARAKEAELHLFRHRTITNARIAAKVPKGHAQLSVKRVDKLNWGLWSKAPEPMGSRLPRRAKSNAIHRMSRLARKRPRTV